MIGANRVRLVLAAALLIAAVALLVSANVNAANRIVMGKATTYGGSQYNGFLALPEGPGHTVRICSDHSGKQICVVQTSNDAGPSKAKQREGKIVDLDAPTFEHLCRCQWRQQGVIEVTVEYLSSGQSEAPQDRNTAPPAARPTLPPTDTGG